MLKWLIQKIRNILTFFSNNVLYLIIFLYIFATIVISIFTYIDSLLNLYEEVDLRYSFFFDNTLESFLTFRWLYIFIILFYGFINSLNFFYYYFLSLMSSEYYSYILVSVFNINSAYKSCNYSIFLENHYVI
jgi:hypothetical protein